MRNSVGGIPKAEGRIETQAKRCPLLARRSAFTLVELLVSIAILAILASLILGVAAVAAETAKEARTKSTITRLHTLLMEHYDSFRNRRVGTQDNITTDALMAVGLDTTGINSGQERAMDRLAATREMMRIELPDRWSDIALADLESQSDGDTPLGPNDPVFLEQRTGMANFYLSRYQRLRNAPGMTVAKLRTNEGAECLYMITMLATGDGEAASLFSENLIGDTDEDGAPEFLDGWGRPIEFLRWAPGYESPAQLSQVRLLEIYDENNLYSDVDAAIAADRDPFDLFRVDKFAGTSVMDRLVRDKNDLAARGYRLLPLIFSAGRDEELGIATAAPFGLDQENSVGMVASNPVTNRAAASNPYRITALTANGKAMIGRKLLDGSTAADDITNHLITSN